LLRPTHTGRRGDKSEQDIERERKNQVVVVYDDLLYNLQSGFETVHYGDGSTGREHGIQGTIDRLTDTRPVHSSQVLGDMGQVRPSLFFHIVNVVSEDSTQDDLVDMPDRARSSSLEVEKDGNDADNSHVHVGLDFISEQEEIVTHPREGSFISKCASTCTDVALELQSVNEQCL
jgi:hypothetical protein